MITEPILLSLCAVIMLLGCSSNTVDYSNNIVASTETSRTLDKTQMQLYIASAQSQLLLLEQQESKRCISGQLAIAHLYLLRATAEHNAGMEKDAFITLVDLDRQVRKIRCINQYINGQLGCGFTNNKVVLKRWYEEGGYDQCDTPLIEKALIEKPSIEKTAVKAITQKIKVEAIKLEKNHLLITETLHDFDQEEIKAIYYPSLNKLIELIKYYPNSMLLISGHTDSKGSEEYNNQLSKKRAQSVAKYFTDKGIKTSQINIQNKGEGNIREVEKSDVSRVFNRYTSITLVLDTSEIKAI